MASLRPLLHELAGRVRQFHQLYTPDALDHLSLRKVILTASKMFAPKITLK